MNHGSSFYAGLVKERLGLSLDEYGYDATLEREMADLEKKLVEFRLEMEDPTAEVGSTRWTRLRSMERRLVDFALSRRISFVDDGWRLNALKQAALEHPAIDPDKRSRGRPSRAPYSNSAIAKNKTLGLDELRLIEDLKKYVRDEFGEEWSDKRAVEKYVHDVHQRQQSKDIGMRNRLSEQRRILREREHRLGAEDEKK